MFSGFGRFRASAAEQEAPAGQTAAPTTNSSPLAAAAAAAAVAQHQAMLLQQQQQGQQQERQAKFSAARAAASVSVGSAGAGAGSAVNGSSAARDEEDVEACKEALQGQLRATQSALSSGAFVLRLRSAVSYLPHPLKVSYGGEDAHFLSSVGGGAIGVADGVGGWQESGVNPADYSRMFMLMACRYLEEGARRRDSRQDKSDTGATTASTMGMEGEARERDSRLDLGDVEGVLAGAVADADGAMAAATEESASRADFEPVQSSSTGDAAVTGATAGSEGSGVAANTAEESASRNAAGGVGQGLVAGSLSDKVAAAGAGAVSVSQTVDNDMGANAGTAHAGTANAGTANAGKAEPEKIAKAEQGAAAGSETSLVDQAEAEAAARAGVDTEQAASPAPSAVREALAEAHGMAETAASGISFIDPRGALDYAHRHTKVAGSSTALVLQLDQQHAELVAANVGDSGFVLIRHTPSGPPTIIARSRPLQHYFDCPLQFGAYPEFVEATDTAAQAEVYRVPVLPGDVVVAGTDGLWDNAFDDEIIACVSEGRGVEEAAAQLAALARRHASDPEFTSPYVREALSQGLDLPWWEKLLGASFKNGRFQLRQLSGGKQDDITCIVAKVVLAPVGEQAETHGGVAQGRGEEAGQGSERQPSALAANIGDMVAEEQRLGEPDGHAHSAAHQIVGATGQALGLAKQGVHPLGTGNEQQHSMEGARHRLREGSQATSPGMHAEEMTIGQAAEAQGVPLAAVVGEEGAHAAQSAGEQL